MEPPRQFGSRTLPNEIRVITKSPSAHLRSRRREDVADGVDDSDVDIEVGAEGDFVGVAGGGMVAARYNTLGRS